MHNGWHPLTFSVMPEYIGFLFCVFVFVLVRILSANELSAFAARSLANVILTRKKDHSNLWNEYHHKGMSYKYTLL